jgi:hypothetical protein
MCPEIETNFKCYAIYVYKMIRFRIVCFIKNSKSLAVLDNITRESLTSYNLQGCISKTRDKNYNIFTWNFQRNSQIACCITTMFFMGMAYTILKCVCNERRFGMYLTGLGFRFLVLRLSL